MRRKPLTKVSVATRAAADEAVAALLSAVFNQPATTYTHFDTGRTQASVYLPSQADWSPSKRRQLTHGLQKLRADGLEVGSGRVSVQRLRHEDWAESWKRHFRPLAIGNALLVKTSWDRRQPRAGQAVVILDPGLSFGTGHHPTTRFCLEDLIASRQAGRRQAFLDMGTGSGILSIAAVRLGFSPVSGFDNDPEAVRVARGNAAANGVARRIRFVLRDLTENKATARQAQGGPRSAKPAAGRFEVVAANLTYDLLLQEQARILAQLKPGARLILAGILHSQFPQVARAYRGAGLRLIRRQRVGEWESGSFQAKMP
jgi:ribosomal protein L11 methyltransferase